MQARIINRFAQDPQLDHVRRALPAPRTGGAGATPGGRSGERPRGAAGSVPPRSKGPEEGFTLVELLVVAFMLIALVGIAVPTFVSQRSNANDAAIHSDLRSAAIALESFRAQNGRYDADALASGDWGYVESVDVALLIDTVNDDDFCLRAWYSPSGRDATGVAVRPEISTEIADDEATWAITEEGIVELGSTNRATVCS